MNLPLYSVFFLSGASALIFELLWFRLCGLAFGNGVWATALVTSSFMAGLALGNAFTIRNSRRIVSPVKWYAGLEIGIGISGVGIVLLLPVLAPLLAPLFRHLLPYSPLVNGLRISVAFSVMAIATTAMGATLPILVKALTGENGNFGAALGKLYGCNTIGAMAGVLAAEAWLVKAFGITGTAIVALACNGVAAAVAIVLLKTGRVSNVARSLPAASLPITRNGYLLLGAACLTGFAALALEVVWFRFVILFYLPSGWNFSVMLACVLAGVGAGGFIGAKVCKSRLGPQRLVAPITALNGIAVIALYAGFGRVNEAVSSMSSNTGLVVTSLFLMFPVSLVSGALFTLIGKLFHDGRADETGSAGLLTFSNTIGGMAGSLVAVFLLIPFLGMERSFFVLSIVYGITGVFLSIATKTPAHPEGRAGIHRYFVPAGSMALFVAALALFPFGKMTGRYLDLSLGDFRALGAKRVAVRESPTETVQILEKELLGRPYYHYLLTNNHSMSGTYFKAKRYMKLYVYLPVALHPNLKRALLVGFGCGSTAKALTDTKSLDAIDIVDISRGVVDMSAVLYPDRAQSPLADPRVRVHIEDGRFYLLTTDKKYDLITAEPPPPKNSGVVNLYTREYFRLLYDRLADGGFVTYWLPVYQFKPDEAKAVVAAFGEVFSECSLWTGSEYEWMLVGAKHPRPPVADSLFVRQWRDSAVAPELRALGFDSPERLGSLFLADGDRLRHWCAGVAPLTDDHPKRLSSDAPDEAAALFDYSKFTDAHASRENFLTSAAIAKLWPADMKAASAPYFDVRNLVNELIAHPRRKTVPPDSLFEQTLTNPRLQGDYLLWALQSDAYAQTIVTGETSRIQSLMQANDAAAIVPFSQHLAARDVVYGDYADAVQFMRLAANGIGSAYLWNAEGMIEKRLLQLTKGSAGPLSVRPPTSGRRP
jgi:spermidine synthase